MCGEVYISQIFQNAELGQKQGIREKYIGEDWAPAQHRVQLPPPHGLDASDMNAKGRTIRPNQFPESIAVWNEDAFAKRVKDIWWAGPFLTVNQKIADVISQFDLGEGGLVSVPLYRADLKTSWPEKHYYINYGGPKDTLVPEESKKVDFWFEIPDTGKKMYQLAPYLEDGDVALSRKALVGPDLWVEEAFKPMLFFNGQVVDALVAAKINVDLDLKQCRIVGELA